MYTFANAADQLVWERLVESSDHYFETKVQINGVEYSQDDDLFDVSSEYTSLGEDQPSVGACLSADLTVSLLLPEEVIPRMAEVRPYVRASNGTTTSEWMPQGVFFIDTRQRTDEDDDLDILTIHCYDAMLKTEADYPSTSHAWPYSDIDVVQEIAASIGNVGVDQRTVALMTHDYQIPLPAGYTMREVLSRIGAMYGGNWICNYDGQLLLVPINSYPEEVSYLVTESGRPITFGGVRILV